MTIVYNDGIPNSVMVGDPIHYMRQPLPNRLGWVDWRSAMVGIGAIAPSRYERLAIAPWTLTESEYDSFSDTDHTSDYDNRQVEPLSKRARR
jgi:hypothetical protein